MKETIVVIIFIGIMFILLRLAYLNDIKVDTRTEEQKCLEDYSKLQSRLTPNYCIKYFK